MRKNLDFVILLPLMALYTVGLAWAGVPLSMVEVFGVVSNVVACTLLRRQNPAAFVIGSAANAALAAYFYTIGLSGQVIRWTIYSAISMASFLCWLLPAKKGKPLAPSFITRNQCLALASGFATMLIVQIYMGRPAKGILDYLSLYLSLAAGLLIMRKKAEAWLFWLGMDVLNLPLFLIAGAPMNIFYGLFSLGNDTAASVSWWKKAKREK